MGTIAPFAADVAGLPIPYRPTFPPQRKIVSKAAGKVFIYV